MINIGRKNIRTLQTPNNQGMARRVDNRLDGIVNSQAARFKTALAVDGSVAFIYNKRRGVISCTCRGMRNLNGFITHELGISGHEVDADSVQFVKNSNMHTAISFEGEDIVKQVGGLNPSQLDDYFSLRNETIVDKIEGNDDYFTEDNAPDILEALFDDSVAPVFSGDGDPMRDILATTNLANGTEQALSPSYIACPICYGSGYVDSWTLFNGVRIVLDASNTFQIEIDNDVSIDSDAQPAVYSIRERSAIQWNEVSLPSSWRHLMRIALFNKGEEVPKSDYIMYFIHPSAPGVKNVLNYQTLSLLNNGNLLSADNKVSILIESLKGPDYPLIFTHGEMLFSLGKPVMMQVPEAEIPNDDEFADWNLNLTFEMEAGVELRENSYIVEGKYTRVWKVSSINRKESARGKSFGYSVSVRALHSFERQYALMNVLGKPRNPFVSQGSSPDMSDDDY